MTLSHVFACPPDCAKSAGIKTRGGQTIHRTVCFSALQIPTAVRRWRDSVFAHWLSNGADCELYSQGRPLPSFSTIHRMLEIPFGNRAATLRFTLRSFGRDKNPGRANHPPDGLLIRPSNPCHYAQMEGFGFDPIAHFCLSSGLRKKCRDQNPGRANHPPDGLLFRPSNPYHYTDQERVSRWDTLSWCRWRDLNPQAFAGGF